MAVLKKKTKIVLGLLAGGLLFVGAVLGMVARDNGFKANQKQTSNQAKEDCRSGSQEIQEKRLVCSQLLEETLEKDENVFAFEEYANIEPVECMFVGCGGFF